MLDRRQVLGLLGAAGAAAAFGLPGITRAASAGAPRLIVILLRGGLDGLHAVVPHGDPDYASARGSLALPSEALLPLDSTFGLHPALAPIHGWFEEGQLLPMHALGLPYRERSHFDAQDVLDNGATRPGGARDGWLNRALHAHEHAMGIAVGPTVPLILRGPSRVHAIDPGRRRAAHDALLDALAEVYAGDHALRRALAGGRESLALLPDESVAGSKRGLGARTVHTLANATTHPPGPTAVVVEIGGWDTHANQGGVRGQLASRLGSLATGLADMRTALGSAWDQTAVVVLTEFGRTIAANGTGGSDHGIGSAGLLLGGAVRGGRVLADWPGLARAARVDGRDLRPTTDIRQVLAGLLRDHLGVRRSGLEAAFPGLDGRTAVDGLIRAG